MRLGRWAGGSGRCTVGQDQPILRHEAQKSVVSFRLKLPGPQVITFDQRLSHELIHSNHFFIPREAIKVHYSSIFEKIGKNGPFFQLSHFASNFIFCSAKPKHELKHKQNEGEQWKTLNFLLILMYSIPTDQNEFPLICIFEFRWQSKKSQNFAKAGIMFFW